MRSGINPIPLDILVHLPIIPSMNLEITDRWSCICCVKEGDWFPKLCVVFQDSGDNYAPVCLKHMRIAAAELEATENASSAE